jgi:23S rRNA maturation mini-RNase III
VNTQVQNSAPVGQSRLLLVHKLYQQYAGMLLGYIVDVVKNQAIAEQYLVAVFKDVTHELDELTNQDVSTFCHLQAMARKKLAEYFNGTVQHNGDGKNKPSICNNKYTQQMTHEQQLVFCGVHWHGKTITSLAAELNKPEESIRKILKDCFTIIRSSN